MTDRLVKETKAPFLHSPRLTSLSYRRVGGIAGYNSRAVQRMALHITMIELNA